MRKVMILGLFLMFFALPVSAATHSEGTNVINNGTIYTISGGQLRPYTSAGAYLSYGFNSWNSVVQASIEDLNLPQGDFIAPRDGKIVCSDRGTDKGTCYLITNGQKAAFTSEDVFKALGYNFQYILTGDVSFLPLTDNISDPLHAHLPGTLINDSGTIKLVSANGTVGVPDMDTLNSWGYSLVDVVNANSQDAALLQVDILPTHAAGQLAWNTTSNVPMGAVPTTPSTVLPAEPIDVCANIEGFQSSVPTGMVQNGANCDVQQQVVQAPAKVTLPKLIGLTLAVNSSSNRALTDSGNMQGVSSDKYDSCVTSSEDHTLNYMQVRTDVPTTLTVRYAERIKNQIGAVMSFTDPKITQYHTVCYSSLNLEAGKIYNAAFDITASGQTVTNADPYGGSTSMPNGLFFDLDKFNN